MKHIKPLPMPLNVAKLFWKHVKKGSPDECWMWTKSKGRKGYGMFKVYFPVSDPVKPGKQFTLYAHRVAYFLHHGVDPYPDLVLHSCDNPPCCNPSHLSTGDNQKNMDQMKERGRRSRGETYPTARFRDQEVVELRIAFSALAWGKKEAFVQLEAARRNCTVRAIKHILYGDTYKHVGHFQTIEHRYLTPDQRQIICDVYTANRDRKTFRGIVVCLAAKFNVDRNSILKTTKHLRR